MFALMALERQRQSESARALPGRVDAVIPWPRLIALIEPHYPQAGQGRQPLGLAKMLRL